MDTENSNNEIQALKHEVKILKGKIRGYQTLSHLFQETKEKNRSLQMQLQAKEIDLVGTEVRPHSHLGLKNEYPEKMATSLTEIPNKITESVEEANSCSEDPTHQSETCSSIENADEKEVVLDLKKKLEDALQLIGEVERKRTSEKLFMKILNEEVKKTKDELHLVKEHLEKTLREKELVMTKVAILERQRDNIPQNAGVVLSTAKETEGAEDWVHLQQEMEMEEADEKDYLIQQLKYNCQELQEKASRWENEHFNLQMEYTKHVNDLRLLLESKNKELVKVTESFNTDKKTLEKKFQALEVMAQKEKEAKLESYNLHQETMRKYKTLEKKFLALEGKNKDPISNVTNPKAFVQMNQASPLPSSESVAGLQQQVNLFKVDFEKEQKERIFAEKRAREFEEKLRYVSKQLETKERQAELELMRIKQMSNSTNAAKMSKMAKTWPCKYCTFINDPQVDECKICKAPKISRKDPSVWKCPNCNFTENRATLCFLCNYERIQSPNQCNLYDGDLTVDGPETDKA